MQKTAAGLLLTLLAATGSAHGQTPQVGRYQMVAVPASQSQLFPKPSSLTRRPGKRGSCTTRRGRPLNGFPYGFRLEKIGLPRPCRPRLTLLAFRAEAQTSLILSRRIPA
jgi:hypothetical protein